MEFYLCELFKLKIKIANMMKVWTTNKWVSAIPMLQCEFIMEYNLWNIVPCYISLSSNCSFVPTYNNDLHENGQYVHVYCEMIFIKIDLLTWMPCEMKWAKWLSINDELMITWHYLWAECTKTNIVWVLFFHELHWIAKCGFIMCIYMRLRVLWL